MIYLKILLSVSALISGVIGIFGNTYENGKITKNGKIVLAVVFVIFILSVWQQVEEDQESQVKDHKAEFAQRKADSLQIMESKLSRLRDKEQLDRYANSIDKFDSIINSAKEQKELSIALRKKTVKIESLQRELYIQEKESSQIARENYNELISKDSYCYVRLLNYSNKARVLLAREGKHSLQNIDFTISNPIKNTSLIGRHKKSYFTEDDFKQLHTVIYRKHINSLPADSTLIYDLDVVIPFNWPEDSLLKIDYSSPNNHWHQNIHTKKEKDGTFTQKNSIVLYVVEKGVGRGKVIKEYENKFN